MAITKQMIFTRMRSIEFWLVFFFIIRLIGITNPPLENGHDWRQCLTNMMSRNLYETDNNPLYPRVDNGGRHEGIIASEFPIYNFVVYLISIPFGYQHWYGRLVNLIISTIACWYFYRLLLLYFSKGIAFNATFLLTVSVWFGFSRKTMPDIFSMALMVIAIYHAFKYLQSNIPLHLLWYGFLGAAAVLAKIPAIYALSIFALPFLNKAYQLLPKAGIVIASMFIAGLMYWWYFVWGDYLLKTWEYQLYFPKNFEEGWKELSVYTAKACEQFYFSAFQSFVAFAVFIWGFIICIKKRNYLPVWILAATLPLFIAFIIKTGNVFALHSYYIIPFVPQMALLAAVGIDNLPKKLALVILAIITIEAIANQQHDFFINPKETYKLNLEREINGIVPKGEKIGVAATTGPQFVYFTHRQGWGLSQEQILDTAYMNFVIYKRHFRYLVVVKNQISTQPNYRLIGEDKDILVYDMLAK